MSVFPLSIPIVLRLVRSFHRHADVVGLFLGELGQLHADSLQVQPGDFPVQGHLDRRRDAGFRRCSGCADGAGRQDERDNKTESHVIQMFHKDLVKF